MYTSFCIHHNLFYTKFNTTIVYLLNKAQPNTIHPIYINSIILQTETPCCVVASRGACTAAL
jgi:hypothetical protein